jgi:hypothetical protein
MRLLSLLFLAFFFVSCGNSETDSEGIPASTNNSNTNTNNSNQNNNNGNSNTVETLNVLLRPVDDCTSGSGNCPGVYVFNSVLTQQKTVTATVHMTFDGTAWINHNFPPPSPPNWPGLDYNCRLQICVGTNQQCLDTAHKKDSGNLYWISGPAVGVHMETQGQTADLEPTHIIPAQTPYRLLCFLHPLLYEIPATAPIVTRVRRQ